MKLPSFVPSPAEIGREAIIVLAGALLAVLIVRALPASYQSFFMLPGGKTS